MIEWIQDVIGTLGYPGITALMFLENVFPPIPSEVIMTFAGFTTVRGELSFVGVVIAGTLGSVLSTLPLYYLGWVVGEDRLKRWADQYGKWLMISGRDIERARIWFDRHGSKAVFFCRLVPGIRSLISIPAGIAKMNPVTFLLYSALGTGLWTGFLTYMGRLLGENYAQIEHYLDPISYAILGSAVVGFVMWIRKRKRRGYKLIL